jgi:hypothetical protein
MGSVGNSIHSAYYSLLSDISSLPADSQPAGSVKDFSKAFMEASATQTAAPAPSAGGGSEASSTPALPPHTLQLQFDTTPGPFYGRPIAPEGASETGEWSVLPDGSYFSASDVNASGVATLHAPPTGWQNTPTGETLSSPAGIMFGNDGGAPVSSDLSTISSNANAEGAPVTPQAAQGTAQGAAQGNGQDTAARTIQVQFDTTPGPLYGRPIAPEGSSETGQWAILSDGSYFSASDVSAYGVATLHAPPAGWQNTPTGETLTAPPGIGGDGGSSV